MSKRKPELSTTSTMSDESTSKSKKKQLLLLKQEVLYELGSTKIRGKPPSSSAEVRNQPLITSTLVSQDSVSPGHTEYHSEITGLAGAIAVIINDVKKEDIEEDIEESSEDTDSNLGDEGNTYYPTARTQVNRSSVNSQGNNVIGKFELIKANGRVDNWNLVDWSDFINKNPQFLGCSITQLHYQNKVQFTGNIRDGFYQEYDTHDKSPYGTPQDENTYFLIEYVNTKTCWLTGLPLLPSGPLKQGKPNTTLQNPHCEHVLSILDALFELALYENEHKQLLLDYNKYIYSRHFDESGLWKNNTAAATLIEFNYSNHQYTEDDWELIKRLKMEYLYALPDPNLEKDDDSLLAWNGTSVIFNDIVANQLADRIWKRLIAPGGLLHLFNVSKNNENKLIWKKNILLAWRKRLDFIAAYINLNKHSNFASLYGFMSICRYLTKLPPIVKNCLLGYKGPEQAKEEVTLYSKKIYLTPSTPFKIALLQNFAVELSKIFLDNISTPNDADKIAIIKIIFPHIDSQPEPFIRRSGRSLNLSQEFPKEILKWISLWELMNLGQISGIRDFLRDNFILCFYNEYDNEDPIKSHNPEYENVRYLLITIVAYKYKIMLLNVIITNITVSITDGDQKNSLIEVLLELKKKYSESLNYSLKLITETNSIKYLLEPTTQNYQALVTASIFRVQRYIMPEDKIISFYRPLPPRVDPPSVDPPSVDPISGYWFDTMSWENSIKDIGGAFKFLFTEGNDVVINIDPSIQKKLEDETKNQGNIFEESSIAAVGLMSLRDGKEDSMTVEESDEKVSGKEGIVEDGIEKVFTEILDAQINPDIYKSTEEIVYGLRSRKVARKIGGGKKRNTKKNRKTKNNKKSPKKKRTRRHK